MEPGESTRMIFAGDRLICCARSDGSLRDQDLLTLRIDAEADDLVHAERNDPSRGEDQQVLVISRAAFHFDHRGQSHGEVASAAVADFGLDVLAVVQRFHFAANRDRLAVQIVGLAADGHVEALPMPLFIAACTAAGSAIVITQPVAFCLTSSSRMNVLSADEPPPTLSPVSNNATGNFVAAIACFHRCGRIGNLQHDAISRVAHSRSPNRLASFSASCAIAVGYDDDARPHVRHVGVLIAAHDADGEDFRVALAPDPSLALVIGSSGSA